MIKKSRFARVLDTIEVVGNKLPHPATLLLMMAVLVALLSWWASAVGLAATHPATGEVIAVRNLLSADGLRWIYTNVESNFVNFPPLGLVLVIMIGIGVAEGSGLFTVLVRQLVLGAPPKLITAAIITAGIFSHLASEVGYVILIPLGAMIFHALGRHPMAGFAAAFADCRHYNYQRCTNVFDVKPKVKIAKIAPVEMTAQKTTFCHLTKSPANKLWQCQNKYHCKVYSPAF